MPPAFLGVRDLSGGPLNLIVSNDQRRSPFRPASADPQTTSRLNGSNLWQCIMGELPRVRPKSRKVWRNWLQKNFASSEGVWLVYAKKDSGLPSLTYNDAVEEALCFGWIDSKVNPIDDSFYMQVFTPRKRASAWSALNKARVERLLAAGLMTPAGLAVVDAAKDLGTWDAWKHVEELNIP